METVYGALSDEQMKEQKKQMHKKVHFLLQKMDAKVEDKFPEVDYDQYYKNLMYKFVGMNKLLGEPKVMIDLLSILESSYIEVKKEDFDFKVFRKLILDAHSLIDRI